MKSVEAIFYFYIAYVVFSIVAILLRWFARKRFFFILNKYNEPNKKYMNSYDAARLVLRDNKVKRDINFRIGESNQLLSGGTIALTKDVAGVKSPAAIAVSVHEAGHAVQYFADNRDSLIRKRDEEHNISILMMLIGTLSPILCLAFDNVIPLLFGLLLIVCSIINKIMYVKVENEASNIGLDSVIKHNIVNNSDVKKVRKVLSAAAFTYVADCIGIVADIMGNMTRALG